MDGTGLLEEFDLVFLRDVKVRFLASADFLLALVAACALEGEFDVLGLVQVEATHTG